MRIGGSPSIVSVRPDVQLQNVGREAILHDRRNGKAHVINGSAAMVWKLCDGRTTDELVAAFAEPCGRTPDEVRPDVERVIASFDALGLLVRRDIGS